MLEWLRRGLRSPGTPAHEVLLDEGLGLAMDWGETWLAPLQGRLVELHPRLEPAELDELDAACRAAMRFGHDTVHGMVRQHGKDARLEDFSAVFLATCPWARPESVSRLFNQGLYYACKAGGPAVER